MTPVKADPAEIRRTLELFFEPGQVTELRLLHVSRPGYRRPHTESGYFDKHEMLAAAAARAAPYAKGVYVMGNIVDPALLARAFNRVITPDSGLTTGDANILRRRWLVIDCDPIRPAEISSTDAEHVAALARVHMIGATLTAAGWPAPAVADSGNGGHLLYRVDLPNDDDSRTFLEQALQALAFRFDDGQVTVDRTMFNAARLCKLYGTVARKGDYTPERPHRLARLLSIPDTCEPVPRELLEALARQRSEMPRDEAPRRGSSHSRGEPFDIDHWIGLHGLDLIGPLPWQRGRRWIFPVCPWNSDHRNRSAFIIQQPSGAVGAGCHHNGCAGRDWHALRDQLEPGWRDASRRRTQPSGVGTAQGNGGATDLDDEAAETPWEHIKTAPAFIAEPQDEFEGLAKDVLAPGAITMLAAPRGLGKTHLAHALGVALATGGVFRGESVKPVQVLLIDRDNPEHLIRQRLQAWGAATANHLHILTRQHAPALNRHGAWAQFPVSAYQALIVDAVGSFTEGITEKEGKQTTEVLATIVDLARKGLAILLLQNATKDGVNFKGREEWADRSDIIYELRDATDFIPQGHKPWWEELPAAHEGAWAARAARRKGRCDFRLAFIPSKYRLGPEPEPFCIELNLPPDLPWTVEDVTEKLQQAGERAKVQAEEAHAQQLDEAAQALAELVKERAAVANAVLKTQAETFLRQERELTRKDARQLLMREKGLLWDIVPLAHARGNPEALLPTDDSSSSP